MIKTVVWKGNNFMSDYLGFNTEAIHYGRLFDSETRAVSQPIVPAVAYDFEDADIAASVVKGEKEGIYYGRYGNPTTQILEKKIAKLENAEKAIGVSSGMAAISSAILAFANTGDHIVVTKDVYGGTHQFLSNFGPRYGIEFDFVDCNQVSHIQDYIKSNTKAIYIETPSNP